MAQPKGKATPPFTVAQLDARSLAGEPLASEARDGVYACANCNSQLYESEDKVVVTGSATKQRMPTFKRAQQGALKYTEDYSYGLPRQLATCAQCNQIIGFVYYTGTGAKQRERHTVYSSSLIFNEVAETSGSEESIGGSVREESSESSEEENKSSAVKTSKPSKTSTRDIFLGVALAGVAVAAVILLKNYLRK